ncbi:hypothetical protein, partial [Leptospira interrogans]
SLIERALNWEPDEAEDTEDRSIFIQYMATHCVGIKNSKKIESLIEEIPFRETYSRNSFQHKLLYLSKKKGSFLLDLPVLEFSL